MDEYNGWANRETWATSLHLGNDEGLNDWALEHARSSVEEAREDEAEDRYNRAVTYCADSLQAGVEEWAQDVADAAAGRWPFEPVPSGIVMMVDEIGSRWRVDWREVARGYVEEAREEEEVDAS